MRTLRRPGTPQRLEVISDNLNSKVGQTKREMLSSLTCQRACKCPLLGRWSVSSVQMAVVGGGPADQSTTAVWADPVGPHGGAA